MAKLTLSVNGKIYVGWKNIDIQRSIEAISGVFSFEFSDQWDGASDPWPLNVQDAVEIKVDNTVIMKGYIDQLKGTLSGNQKSYSIEGRDATSDLVDCSAPQATTEWASISIMNLARQLTFGMKIDYAWGEGIEARHQRSIPFTLERGETIFEALDRFSSRVGVLMVPDGKGGVLFSTRGAKRARDVLKEGVNAKEFSFVKNFAERFSDYLVEGRTNKTTSTPADGHPWFGPNKGAKNSLPNSLAKDYNIKRYRPLYIQRSGVNDQQSIEEFAETEAQIRAGKSLQVTCTVQGWTETNGDPWLINRLVRLDAPRLGIGSELGEDYLITDTHFTLSVDGGQITVLTLLPPEAFSKQKNVDKKKRDGKGAKWGGHPWMNPKYKPQPGSATPKGK